MFAAPKGGEFAVRLPGHQSGGLPAWGAFHSHQRTHKGFGNAVFAERLAGARSGLDPGLLDRDENPPAGSTYFPDIG